MGAVIAAVVLCLCSTNQQTNKLPHFLYHKANEAVKTGWIDAVQSPPCATSFQLKRIQSVVRSKQRVDNDFTGFVRYL